jgi:hypothetical protein
MAPGTPRDTPPRFPRSPRRQEPSRCRTPPACRHPYASGWSRSGLLVGPIASVRVRGCGSRQGRAAMAPPPRLVSEPRYPILEKPLCPLVHKAAVDADRRRNRADRHPFCDEEDNPPPTCQTSTDGRRSLPRPERVSFRRREADAQGSFPTLWHSKPLTVLMSQQVQMIAVDR